MNSSLRPMLVIGAIALSVAVVVGVSDWRAAHAKEVIPWRSDLAAAEAEAKASGRPVFAYFTASWCPPCQAMKGTTWADETVRQAMEKFVPVKIDVDARKDLSGRYGVEEMPTYLILSDGGTVERKRVGLMRPEEMTAWLER